MEPGSHNRFNDPVCCTPMGMEIMHRRVQPCKNQEGSALLIALIVLLIASILGFNALTTTQTELKVAGNDRRYKQNFYRAEAVIKEAASALEAADDTTSLNSELAWLGDGSDAGTGFDPEGDAWKQTGNDANAGASTFYTDGKAAFCALRRAVASGSNLDMSRKRKWEYVIYGRSQLSSGQVDLAAGYLKKTH